MRVVIADDSVIVREGLRRLLELEGIEVAHLLSRADALPAAVAESRPDVVIVDIRMPPTHTDEGLVAAADLRQRLPDLGILVLSQYVVPEYAARLLEGGERYSGYLLKERVLEPAQLSAALARVASGGTVVDQDLVSTLLANRHHTSALDQLTAREREILELMATGLSDKGIAERLVLSVNTVGTHVVRIFRKLGLPDAATDNRRVLAVLDYLR